jgi:hypothetical protein
MRTASAGFEQFVRRVHRRYVLLRLLERTGLGILGGCAAAMPLLGIALWRGLATLPLAATAVVLGAVAGAWWGFISRPSTLAAAIEADRQLDWADLMSSAMAVQSRSQDDPWVGVVTAAADARCRGVGPSAVVLNRLGARAWGGIGLAAALVAVLGLIPTYAISTQAGDIPGSAKNLIAGPDSQEQQGRSGTRSVARRTPTQEEPDDPGASRMNGVEPIPQQESGRAKSAASDDRHRENSNPDPNGQGKGASHSNAPTVDPRNRSQAGTGSRVASAEGNPADGVGEASARAGEGSGASGQAAGSNRDRVRPAPPWKSADWAVHSQHAADAIDSGRIPDAYRDMVRGYFERP